MSGTYKCVIELEIEAEDESDALVQFWQEIKEDYVEPDIEKIKDDEEDKPICSHPKNENTCHECGSCIACVDEDKIEGCAECREDSSVICPKCQDSEEFCSCYDRIDQERYEKEQHIREECQKCRC